jgi:hypothetical protein
VKIEYAKRILGGVMLVAMLSGCTMVSHDRVFPKFTWYWTKDAKAQRAEDKLEGKR